MTIFRYLNAVKLKSKMISKLIRLIMAIAVLNSLELVEAKGGRSGGGSRSATSRTSSSYRAASYYTYSANYYYTDSFGAVIIVNYGNNNYYYDYQYGTTLANPHYRSSSGSLGGLIILIVICVFICGGCGNRYRTVHY